MGVGVDTWRRLPELKCLGACVVGTIGKIRRGRPLCMAKLYSFLCPPTPFFLFLWWWGSGGGVMYLILITNVLHFQMLPDKFLNWILLMFVT